MNLLIVMIVLLWGINSLSCLMGYEGDWSNASAFEMIAMTLLFLLFGPCIMLANIVVGLVFPLYIYQWLLCCKLW